MRLFPTAQAVLTEILLLEEVALPSGKTPVMLPLPWISFQWIMRCLGDIFKHL